jgi:hypothetical protein
MKLLRSAGGKTIVDKIGNEKMTKTHILKNKE